MIGWFRSEPEPEPTPEEIEQTNQELESLGLPPTSLTEILEIREKMPDFKSDRELESN